MGLRTEMVRRLLYLLTALFIAAGAATASDAYYTYRSPPVLASAKKVLKLDESLQNSAKKKYDYAVIIRRNLFASRSFRTVKPIPIALTKRPTPPRARRIHIQPLGLRLVGTTVGPKDVRYAIFEIPGSRRHVIYRPGERLEGALIQAIERTEVHLMYQGEVKILRAFAQGQK